MTQRQVNNKAIYFLQKSWHPSLNPEDDLELMVQFSARNVQQLLQNRKCWTQALEKEHHSCLAALLHIGADVNCGSWRDEALRKAAESGKDKCIECVNSSRS